MHQAMHIRLAPRQPNLRPKVLFVAEDVTLAHVGRMIALAQSLDAAHYDIAVACGDRYAGFVRQAGLRHVFLPSMSPTYFAERLAAGKPVHVQPLLEEQVRADLVLLSDEQPDLVVGDFRVSLGISAEVAGIPYASVVNAYWSEASTLKFPIPDIPVVRLFGVGVASVFFPVILPVTLRAYLRPYNAVRRAYGLARLSNLMEMYTHGNWTLYADLPRLAPTRDLPSNQRYLGPVLWEPDAALPNWWHEITDDRPVVYVNLGSSGHRRILDVVAHGLANLPLTVMLATAGASVPEKLPENFRVATYLPGTRAAAHSDLVVCNGGSGTIYQALSVGIPVLGLASNADQFLAMQQVVTERVGRLLRASTVDAKSLRQNALALLHDESATAQARVIGRLIQTHDTAAQFRAFVAEATGRSDASRIAPAHQAAVA